jgi:hypothetical protein
VYACKILKGETWRIEGDANKGALNNKNGAKRKIET